MSRLGHIYNLKPALKTGDEKVFGIENHTVETVNLPPTFDLRIATNCIPPILNQFSLGSCASNELSNALRFCLAKEKQNIWQPSRLYLYYFGRLFEGSPVTEDTGTSITGLCSAVVKYGVCSEINWPYTISKFATQPSRDAILAAHMHCTGYSFINVPQDLVHMKQALLNYPIIIGIQVYSSFESDTVAKTGIVPMPDTTNEVLLGGHAVNIVAYSDVTQTFTCSNSWGLQWGKNGYFTIPYDYLLDPNLAEDFCQVHWFK
jgi:hypothetical protein